VSPAGVSPGGGRLTSTTHRVADERAAQELFLRNGWSDGLPVVPPTPDLVEAFVDAYGEPPDTVLGTIPEQGRTVSLEKLAVNAVLAGARPEYMSVLVSTVIALTRPEFNLHSTTVSGATAPLVLVTGEAVPKIALNSSFSVFGPGFHANATIGRAIRLLLHNVCGAVPGLIDKATMGHPGKFSYCIAESPERNPWPPLHVERGFPDDDSAVTVFAGEAPINARNDWATEPGPILATIADAMLPSHYTGGSFVVVLGPMHAATLARAGLSRADVRAELHARARRSVASLKRAGRLPGPIEPDDEDEQRPAAPSPESILVTVAGGHLYGYSAVVPSWVGGHESTPVTQPLRRD
jgi:hypothetical protein